MAQIGAIAEIRNSKASVFRRFSARRAFQVPRSWRSGSCVVALNVVHAGDVAVIDRIQINAAFDSIIDECIERQGVKHGAMDIGDERNVLVTVHGNQAAPMSGNTTLMEDRGAAAVKVSPDVTAQGSATS